MTDYLPLVREAAAVIRPHVVRTPLVRSERFSNLFRFPVYLKLESLQVTGAFKIRGAMNKVLALKKAGVAHVVAASSGSHAMGVSLAARTCGMRATIVMSESSPELKRRKVLGYGAELVVQGRNYDDSAVVAAELAGRTGAELVSGVEDELVMAGHGTMGLEILEDLPEVDFVVMPIGGGGAISGLLMALKGRASGGAAGGRDRGQDHGGGDGPERGRRGVRVWGVQAGGAPSMKVSLDRGEVTELPTINTLADAIAVRKPGTRPFRMVRELGDGVATVDDGSIVRAIGRLALWDKLVAEPAGAAGLAVDWPRVLRERRQPTPQAAVFVVTGGNVPRELLARALNEGGVQP